MRTINVIINNANIIRRHRANHVIAVVVNFVVPKINIYKFYKTTPNILRLQT